MSLTRSSGILLHPTSLPGPGPIGSLGREAYAFIDFLAETGQSIWQILPLNPTGYGDSPYSAFSAFAGNPLLISLPELVAWGDLEQSELPPADPGNPQRVDFGRAHQEKEGLLRQAAERFRTQASPQRRQAFEEFCTEQGYWLHDYVLFRALRERYEDRSWNLWPQDLRHRDAQALEKARQDLQQDLFWRLYAQFAFFSQWFALKDYANEQGVRIFGDIPIFVAFDSVDVWANQGLFHLDDEGNPTLVAGVPPDYFSATGQRWGNPLYRWERMAAQGYSWWIARFRWNLIQTDLVRIDHFRGFEACWAIPAEEKTAINGEWMDGPGDGIFQALEQALGEVPIIAEDLGLITAEVEALRDRFGFPGMKVLHFAFGDGPDNPYLPHNLERNSVVYTGTHDNNTTLGWWQELSKKDKDAVRAYLGHGAQDMPWDLNRTAMAAVSNLCILPMQDILGLGADGRMNLPGEGTGNWDWRYQEDQLTNSVVQRLKEMTHLYGRATAS
ncbi:4-alpha-glucanotransferase [Geoalkalibacter ferrihydriticus]|uniref:4-alpha-glucanotransferase n=2 Tax=Geoalkalibacter ferrihydriticus TaxID=392333 RepID=A0A0C2HT44_9BACT|nr:4-alpha-glucanotransferase [Geoalkalibacter ferrihydriticus]KIH77985.1 4-alpha-glucanotransferase [Geoalkalibacter ferrihydriticus DSM 17813]SDM34161.1 4-alpha-glucanotransferase [Geoalkalibacter ferrihydriticus]